MPHCERKGCVLSAVTKLGVGGGAWRDKKVSKVGLEEEMSDLERKGLG